MANHPQAEKRNRQRIKRQSHHRHYRTHMRTQIKGVQAALKENDVDKAREALKAATPLIDRCGQRGVIPRERANRMISRLTKAVNAASAS